MFYHNLRFVNVIFTVFGIRKPFPSSSGKPLKICMWYKTWSLIIMALIIVSYINSIESGFTTSLKKNLNLFYKTNDMMVNILIIVINLLNGEKICIKLYEGVEITVQKLRLSESNLKLFSLKICLGFVASMSVLIVAIVCEIFYIKASVFLITLPMFFSTFHLVFHLCLFLALLKLVSMNMTKILTFDQNMKSGTNFMMNFRQKSDKIKYVLSPTISFFEIEQNGHYDLKFLCKIYDDLTTFIQMLDQHHGVQMLLTFWLMLINSVIGITTIAGEKADFPALVVARCIFPFFWCLFGTVVNDQISKEVDQIDMTIIKCLIDFRCDQPRKAILQTFKQLTATNRLQFTACSLFHLNYSMILGTIVNVITYSIILIQLFIIDDND